MPLIWNDSLTTGVEVIDRQHRELFDRINKVLDASNQGKGREIVAETFQFMQNYVTNHFGTEEELMLKHNYPEYPAHKRYHTQYVNDLSSLKQQLDTTGSSLNLVVQTNKLLVDWWINHINRVDKSLGTFLKSKQSPE